jgi:Domain of unknown function (DUF4827)
MFYIQHFRKMKQFPYYIALFSIISSVFSSCSDTVTYASQVAAENSLIADYVKRKEIHEITTLPNDTAYWNATGHKNDYFHSASGLYFRLVKGGNPANEAVIRKSEVIGARFQAYTLTAIPDTTVNYLSNTSLSNPAIFVFGSGNYTSVCAAFNEAAGYMNRSDSEAWLVVPSKIGFSADAQAIRPMVYYLRITFNR